MTTSPPPLHPLEQEVMDAIWDRGGESTVRDILEAINAVGDKQRAYTTVMTIMSRLDGKGLLRRHRQGKTDIYAAVLDRNAYREARATAAVGALLDQFGDAALVQFARHVDALEPAQRRTLRRRARHLDD